MSNYFCGWYFKCQSGSQTLSVIPAFHEKDNHKSCSIQVITEEGVWNIPFSFSQFRFKKGCFSIAVGDNIFSQKGMRLNLHTEELSMKGTVTFGKFSPIRYDIMGPFRYVPFMECRHSVFSMLHTVNGQFSINGVSYPFISGLGYMEGDRGRSFPTSYAWTHCFFENGSLMLSVADIPIGCFHFTGIIGIIKWQDKEYRLATYLGARPLKIQNHTLVIRQGKCIFAAKLLKQKAHPLYAPIEGNMTRTIHENPSCCAAYKFKTGKKTHFSFSTDIASFEYEYPQ